MSSIDTLKANIASNEFKQLYFIYGEEGYLREYYKSQIISAFEKDGFSDFNLLICDSDNTSAEEIEEFFDSQKRTGRFGVGAYHRHGEFGAEIRLEPEDQHRWHASGLGHDFFAQPFRRCAVCDAITP